MFAPPSANLDTRTAQVLVLFSVWKDIEIKRRRLFSGFGQGNKCIILSVALNGSLKKELQEFPILVFR